MAVKTYRFNAPVHDQFQQAGGPLVFGGQEVKLEESEALDPRLELVGEEAASEETDSPGETESADSEDAVPETTSGQGRQQFGRSK